MKAIGLLLVLFSLSSGCLSAQGNYDTLFFEGLAPLKHSFLLNGKEHVRRKKDTLYVFRELMPQFPGGQSALFHFMANHLEIPETNQDSGRVLMSFLITSNGEIEDITVVESLNPAVDSAAVDLIRKFPIWNPGMQDGKFVDVTYRIPIRIVFREEY